MAKIQVECPDCQTVLAVDESWTGKKVRCPKCKAVVAVAGGAAAESATTSEFRSDVAPPRPRRFKQKKRGTPVAALVTIIVASVLLIAGASIGGYYLFKGKRGGASAAQKRPTPTDLRTGTDVNMVAQDIAGEDLDGVPFKLSDYRGKVVLLDFWHQY